MLVSNSWYFSIVFKSASLRVPEIRGGNWGTKRRCDLPMVACLISEEPGLLFRVEGLASPNWGTASSAFGWSSHGSGLIAYLRVLLIPQCLKQQKPRMLSSLSDSFLVPKNIIQIHKWSDWLINKLNWLVILIKAVAHTTLHCCSLVLDVLE